MTTNPDIYNNSNFQLQYLENVLLYNARLSAQTNVAWKSTPKVLY